MRLIIVTAIWKRHPLTKIVLDYYSQLAQDGPHDISLLAVGSEGKASETLCNDAGWNYIKAPNEPLSQKFNAVFEGARKYEPDAVLLVGSDDLLEYMIIDYYMKHYGPEENYLLGLRDIYFYCIENSKAIYFPGYGPPSPKTIGAGRIFSRSILEQLKWRPWGEEVLPRGLDTACTKRMERLGIGEVAIPMCNTKGILCDFKMRMNYPRESLTPFGRLTERSDEANTSILDLAFPEQMKQIKALKI